MHFSVKKWKKAWLKKESSPEFDPYFFPWSDSHILLWKNKEYAFVIINMTLLLQQSWKEKQLF